MKEVRHDHDEEGKGACGPECDGTSEQMVTRTAVTGTAVPPTRTHWQTSREAPVESPTGAWAAESTGADSESLREEPGPFKFKLNAAGEQVIMMGMYIMIP